MPESQGSNPPKGTQKFDPSGGLGSLILLRGLRGLILLGDLGA
jgi:hypothetical protein